MKKLLAFLIFASTAFSTVTLLEPINVGALQSTEVSLGNVMPGQTLELIFTRDTGTTGQMRAIFWETATATLPDNSTLKSQLMGGRLSLKIPIPKGFTGKYALSVRMEGTQIGIIQAETVNLWVNVQNGLYGFDMKPEYHISAGQPNNIPVTVTSSSAASDTLSVTSTEGMPFGWFDRQPTYIRYVSSREMNLDIAPFEEGYYPTKISISRASDGVLEMKTTAFRVTPTLKSKLKAYSEGISIVPVILQPFYSVLSFLGLL